MGSQPAVGGIRGLATIGTVLAAAAAASPALAKAGQGSNEPPLVKLTAEPVANVRGGKSKGATYAQQLELNVKLDWEKIAGIHGLTTHVTFVNRFGDNVSTRYVGDSLFQSQAIYGGTDHAPIHLVQAYAEEQAGAVDVAAGRLPVGEAFAQSPLYCKFMSTAICGYPNSLAAKEGFTTFPNSTWGTRLRVSPSNAFSFQGGAYQVRPKLGGKYGFDWGWSGTTGIYLPVEARWTPSFRSGDLPGHYKAGFAYDTSDYDDNYRDRAGRPFVLGRTPPLKHRSRKSLYLLADQMIARHGKGDTNGLILIAGFVHSDPRDSQLANSAFAGLVDQGLIAGRPDDTAGLVVAYADVSDSLIATQRLQQALGLPLSKADAVQSHEMVIEADYEARIDKHFKVMPDVQYVIRPGAADTHRNALVVGARLTAQF